MGRAQKSYGRAHIAHKVARFILGTQVAGEGVIGLVWCDDTRPATTTADLLPIGMGTDHANTNRGCVEDQR